MNPVETLMQDLGAGRIALAEVIEHLPALLRPRHVRRPAADVMELLRREQDDELPPHTPCSWDDVEAAYVAHGVITAEQYEALAAAVAPPAAVVVDY